MDYRFKIINKSGIKGINKELEYALMEELESIRYYGGDETNFKCKVDYNFTNNGNTWQRSTFHFRKTKKGYVVE